MCMFNTTALPLIRSEDACADQLMHLGKNVAAHFQYSTLGMYFVRFIYESTAITTMQLNTWHGILKILLLVFFY